MLNFFSLLFLVLLVACGGARRLPPASGLDAELDRCLKYSSKKEYKQAVECLEVFKSRYPTGDSAANAELLIADNYYRSKEYALAAASYQEFLKRYPGHPKIDYAYYRSGLSYLKETPKAVDRDQQYLENAVQNFEMVVKYLPNSPYAEPAKEEYNQSRLLQAKRHYYVARFYYKYGEYLASLPRFVTIINEYPGLGLDEKSFYYLILALQKTGQKDQAQEAIEGLKKRYPTSSYLKKVKL